jgi:nucleotide-binding universal stress UspA family protein
MKTAEAGTRIAVKNILYLADFSEPSEAALPFAAAIAREFGATIHALHVLIPTPAVYTVPDAAASILEAEEETAQAGMARVDAQLTGVPHVTSVVRGVGVWPVFEQQIVESKADLIVLGTHGRTGAQKWLLGSVAEEVFRRSEVPVLTIGPLVPSGVHNGAHFRRVLFATDFTPESLAAAPHAISLAEENEGRLILLHVLPEPRSQEGIRPSGTSVANAMFELYELVPREAEVWCRPEAVVEHGEPAERILWAAGERDADLIVLGVRGAAGRLGAATHLGKTTAHKIVAHAKCPVLTVRG